MRIKELEVQGINIIKFAGKLNNATVNEFSDIVSKFIINNCRIVLDMNECEYISNAGFRLLLLISRDVSEKNGKACIVGLAREFVEVMNLTGFENICSMYSSLEEVFKIWGKEFSNA